MFLNDVVIGIDIASDSFVAAILAPDASVYMQPKKFYMNSCGFNEFLSAVKKAEKWFNNSPKLFLESTGIYHRPLFLFLNDKGYDVSIINPLSIKDITFDGLRKVKNDNRDSLKIALACKQLNIPTCYVPDQNIQVLRNLVRTYYSLTDNRADLKLKLGNELHCTFPGFKDAFSDITSLTAIKILESYSTPTAFVAESKEHIVNMIQTYSRKGLKWSNAKYDYILEGCKPSVEAKNAMFLGIAVKSYIHLINQLDEQINLLVDEIKNLLHHDNRFSKLNEDVELLDSLDGVGFISAVTLIAEIGDLSRFSSPKQVVAYLGIDPSVNESGKFKGDRNSMSKRGSRLGRRVLFTIAMASIRKSKTGEPINYILREYYLNKCLSKKKKVALGAVMNKLVKYIYAILRDRKPYVSRKPEEHINLRLNLVALPIAA